MAEGTWRTSSYSGTRGECVEVADTLAQGAAIRDSKNRGAGHLVVPPMEWTAFLVAVKAADL
ncbi:DUF397 domain-containing protein [Streptomonospora sp. S1-112]|uniref:DUF397 domain-containing protein n=1 Tax=Streptomonospora mangrovi TaxID=2883123 RepID=A0A9X3NK52_9ACTN|nr:DUF397 domain-containing protein [Streptomonospora mangrovi]MDA0565294.1 DUF397 domain-containing protein [Streptomonospora mangrovi]